MIDAGTTETIARRFIVTGRVQGVCYRAATRDEATRLGVTGWVRNRRDGTVEVHAEATPAKLELLQQWLAQGPRYAAVSEVRARELAAENSSGFEIRHDSR